MCWFSFRSSSDEAHSSSHRHKRKHRHKKHKHHKYKKEKKRAEDSAQLVEDTKVKVEELKDVNPKPNGGDSSLSSAAR